jgi:glycosyltransferase involved in cell wall biosynthesis
MPDRPLTILQLTHQGGGSGSTTIIADLSRQLALRGHRVLVGCRPDTKLAGLTRDAGLGVVPLDFGRLVPLARALEGVAERERVDVVNSNATRDRRALTWLRWTRRLGRPFVVTRHTMPLTSPAELVAVGLSADRTIAVSHAVARALRRRLHPGGRLRVVTNGIDLARVDARPSEADVASARAALGDLAGRPVVLILARR